MYKRDLAQARAFDELINITVPVLNDRYGEGWEKRISEHTLNIEHPNFCIVGQLEGNWNEVWPRMKNQGFTEDQVPALLAPHGISPAETKKWYRHMTCAWAAWFRRS